MIFLKPNWVTYFCASGSEQSLSVSIFTWSPDQLKKFDSPTYHGFWDGERTYTSSVWRDSRYQRINSIKSPRVRGSITSLQKPIPGQFNGECIESARYHLRTFLEERESNHSIDCFIYRCNSSIRFRIFLPINTRCRKRFGDHFRSCESCCQCSHLRYCNRSLYRCFILEWSKTGVPEWASFPNCWVTRCSNV
ncbi:hypothetical protein L218DRAFT_472403 [Marasmius fiardii PR-910]|nr:hypothetical protein L218DRAFT_472403 [Marasmius fiardii PR-910]